jgi:hypothetical protein
MRHFSLAEGCIVSLWRSRASRGCARLRRAGTKIAKILEKVLLYADEHREYSVV